MSASDINRIYQKIESIHKRVQGCIRMIDSMYEKGNGVDASQPLAFPQPGRAVSERAANQIWVSMPDDLSEWIDEILRKLNFGDGVHSENQHRDSYEHASHGVYSRGSSMATSNGVHSTLEHLQITSTASRQIQESQSNRTTRDDDLRAQILASRANIHADRLQQPSQQISTGLSQAHTQGLDQQSPRSSQQVSTINRSNKEVLKRINSAETPREETKSVKGDRTRKRLGDLKLPPRKKLSDLKRLPPKIIKSN